MTLMERRRALMFNQGGRNYFDIHKAYDKVGWTVSNGVAYTTYTYAQHGVPQYGSNSFYLDAGSYKVSFDIMISGSATSNNYRYIFRTIQGSSYTLLVNRGNIRLPEKDKYYRISYDVTLSATEECAIGMIADYAGSTTYLKNIRIEKVG